VPAQKPDDKRAPEPAPVVEMAGVDDPHHGVAGEAPPGSSPKDQKADNGIEAAADFGSEERCTDPDTSGGGWGSSTWGRGDGGENANSSEGCSNTWAGASWGQSSWGNGAGSSGAGGGWKDSEGAGAMDAVPDGGDAGVAAHAKVSAAEGPPGAPGDEAPWNDATGKVAGEAGPAPGLPAPSDGADGLGPGDGRWAVPAQKPDEKRAPEPAPVVEKAGVDKPQHGTAGEAPPGPLPNDQKLDNGIEAAVDSGSEERRTDPDTGQEHTFAEFEKINKGKYTPTEIKEYWRDACRPVGQAPPQPEEHPHQNEEWYQKWLRRQKNKPRQIIEIGVDRPQEPPKEEEKNWEATPAAETGSAEVEEHHAEPEKKAYEQEEWYQKWLRRQANKDRKIIQIG